MIAFHGDESIKSKYIARVQEHMRLDQVVQGIGFSNGRGCAIGCTLDSYDHKRYPIELGIPEVLGYLEDAIHEQLSCDLSKEWPLRFLSAIRPGADLSRVWPEFAIWMLTDPEDGALKQATGYPDVEKVILRVAELYRNGGTEEEFMKAATEAAEVAWAAEAAWTAAEAARMAAEAARMAAEAARMAAEAAWTAAEAAWTAAEAAARMAVWTAARMAAEAVVFAATAADKFIQLLSAA